MRSNSFTTLTLSALGLAAGCSSNLPCTTTPPVSPPMVTVIDANTDKPLCNATVFLIDASEDAGPDATPVDVAAMGDAAPYDPGGETSYLQSFEPRDGGACTYTLEALGLPPVWTLRVSLAGYEPQDVRNVRDNYGVECNDTIPPTQYVTVRLKPVGS